MQITLLVISNLTLLYFTLLYFTLLVGFRQKEGLAVQRTQASRDVVNFLPCAGPLYTHATLEAFGD
jgi:hypothetical protein